MRKQLILAALLNHRIRRKKKQRKPLPLSTAKQISVDAAVAAVSSELGGFFALRESQRMAVEDVFTLLPNGSDKSLVQNCGTWPPGSDVWLMSPLAPIGSPEPKPSG